MLFKIISFKAISRVDSLLYENLWMEVWRSNGGGRLEWRLQICNTQTYGQSGHVIANLKSYDAKDCKVRFIQLPPFWSGQTLQFWTSQRVSRSLGTDHLQYS